MTNLNKFLTDLYATVRSEPTATETSRLAYMTLDNVREYTTGGSGRAMRLTALDAVENVLDIAANQGTSEDLQELTQVLDRDAGSYGPNPEDTQHNDLFQKVMGELWNHNFTPEYVDDSYGSVLDGVLQSWCDVLSDAAQRAVVAYVKENWEEDSE